MLVKGVSKWSIVKMMSLLSLYSILFVMTFDILAHHMSIINVLLILLFLGVEFYLVVYYVLKLVYWDLYKVKLTMDKGFSVKKVVLGVVGMLGAFFMAYGLTKLTIEYYFSALINIFLVAFTRVAQYMSISNLVLILLLVLLFFGLTMFVLMEGLCNISTRSRRLVVRFPTSYYIKQGVISIGSLLISFIIAILSWIVWGVSTVLFPLSLDVMGLLGPWFVLLSVLVSFSYAQLLMIYNYAKARPISDVDIDITNSKFEEELLKNKLKGDE